MFSASACTVQRFNACSDAYLLTETETKNNPKIKTKQKEKSAYSRRSGNHSLANCDSCPSPAKSEAIEYLQVGPTEIRYSTAWTIFVYL